MFKSYYLSSKTLSMCEQVLMVFLELVQRMNLIGVAEGNFDKLSPNNLSHQEIAPLARAGRGSS